jgi:hypothetical protein
MSQINNLQMSLRNTGSQYPGLPLDALAAFGGNSYFATLNSLLTSTDESKKYLYGGARVVDIGTGRIYKIKNTGTAGAPVFKGILDDNKRVWHGTTIPSSNVNLSDALIDDIYIQSGTSDIIWKKSGVNNTTTDYTTVINLSSLLGSAVEYYVSDITIATNGTTDVPVTLKRTGGLTNLTANIPAASVTTAGVLSSGVQNIGGNKIFNESVVTKDKFQILDATPGDGTVLFQVFKSGSVANISNTGTLANTGAVTFNNTLNVLSDRTTLKELTVNQTASVTGAVTLGSTLNVSGATILSDRLSTLKYASAGFIPSGTTSAFTVNLANGNTHFLNQTSATAVTIRCNNSDTTDLWNYRGGSFIISVRNSSASPLNVTFSSPVFSGINSDIVALAAGQGLTYSGVVMGIDENDCAMYGIVSPLTANLML